MCTNVMETVQYQPLIYPPQQDVPYPARNQAYPPSGPPPNLAYPPATIQAAP